MNTSAEKEWLKKMSVSNTKIRSKTPIQSNIEGNTSEIPKEKAYGGFKDVAGMDELKTFVTESYINLLRYEKLAKEYGIEIPNLMLYGPKGNGKTYISEKIAQEAGINCIKTVPSTFGSIYVHGTQLKIKKIFDEAAKKAPCILIIDEFESLCASRTADDRSNSNGEVNEFLVQLAECGAKGVHAILCTNHPEFVDDSILRTGRVDNKIYIPLPDVAAREGIFRLELSRRPSTDDIDFAYLAGLTEGYCCSDIKSIVMQASRNSFNKTIGNPDRHKELITQEDVEKMIAHVNPSVTKKQLREYDRIRNDFCNKDEKVPDIGIGYNIHL